MTEFGDQLRRYLTHYGYGSQIAASKVVQSVRRDKLLARSTLDSWLIGTRPSVRSIDKVIALIYTLKLSHQQADALLESAELPSLAVLETQTDDWLRSLIAQIRQTTVGPGETETTAPYKWLRGHTYNINALDISPKGRKLASCSGDCRAIIWDIAGGQPLQRMNHRRWVGSVKFTADSQRIVTSDGNGVLRLWRVHDGKLLQKVEGHDGASRTVAIRPKTTMFVSSGADGFVRLWQDTDLALLYEKQLARCEIRRVAFDRRGEHLLFGTEDGKAAIWHIKNDTITTLKQINGEMVRSVAFAPMGSICALTYSSGGLFLFDIGNGEEIVAAQAHEGHAIGLAFRPKSHQVATSGQDNLIRIWDYQAQLIEVFEGHQDTVTGLTFSANGQQLFSVSRDKKIGMWNIESSSVRESYGNR